MTTCSHYGCKNEPDMYSRRRLCAMHQRQRERDLRFELFFRLFTLFNGTLTVVGLVSAIVGVNNYFDLDITFLWNFSLMMLGLAGFVIFHRRSTIPLVP